MGSGQKNVTPTERSSRGHPWSLISNGQVMHKWLLYLHTLMNFHGIWTKEHVTPTQRSSRGHLRALTSNGQVMHKWLLYSHTLMDFHGIWTEEYWGRGTLVTPATS